MARRADGFLLAVPKRTLAAYRSISRKAAKIWKEYGALEYIECAGGQALQISESISSSDV